jgi:hypothetical protein
MLHLNLTLWLCWCIGTLIILILALIDISVKGYPISKFFDKVGLFIKELFTLQKRK